MRNGKMKIGHWSFGHLVIWSFGHWSMVNGQWSMVIRLVIGHGRCSLVVAHCSVGRCSLVVAHYSLLIEVCSFGHCSWVVGRVILHATPDALASWSFTFGLTRTSPEITQDTLRFKRMVSRVVSAK